MGDSTQSRGTHSPSGTHTGDRFVCASVLGSPFFPQEGETIRMGRWCSVSHWTAERISNWYMATTPTRGDKNGMWESTPKPDSLLPRCPLPSGPSRTGRQSGVQLVTEAVPCDWLVTWDSMTLGGTEMTRGTHSWDPRGAAEVPFLGPFRPFAGVKFCRRHFVGS